MTIEISQMLIVLVLLIVFILIWLFTRNNVANIGLLLPIWGLLIYIILHAEDTWIQISCESGIVFMLIISLARVARRAR